MIRVSRSDIPSANGGTAEPAPAGTRVAPTSIKRGPGWPVGQLEADCGADCHTGQVTSPHLTIGRAASDDELTEFLLFANEVYAQRPAHWVTTPGDLVPLLKGGPTAAGRSTLPLVARSAGGSSPEPLRL